MGNPENIHSLLSQGELGSLLVELQKIKQLNQVIKPLLPLAYQDVCQVSRIQKSSVTLDVPNGSVATLLRYELPNILSKLRQDKTWMGLASIKTRVAPPQISPGQIETACKAENPVKRDLISEQTREQLQSMANCIDDEGLRDALLALASHL